MKKQMIALGTCLVMAVAALPSMAACPCQSNPCPCAKPCCPKEEIKPCCPTVKPCCPKREVKPCCPKPCEAMPCPAAPIQEPTTNDCSD